MASPAKRARMVQTTISRGLLKRCRQPQCFRSVVYTNYKSYRGSSCTDNEQPSSPITVQKQTLYCKEHMESLYSKPVIMNIMERKNKIRIMDNYTLTSDDENNIVVTWNGINGDCIENVVINRRTFLVLGVLDTKTSHIIPINDVNLILECRSVGLLNIVFG
ncbi:hypothetical protein [Trichoplusia ni ascovirus 2c]|uniref:hypothetical protein n=1 Tax=Trichoplusia ni ascovirus 2c TaxID=328615 RepID=UPI0000E441F1|nr:hypothetical protein TNAV2c_gp025 [Trichoplusia ni ascovirus 2c]ABF70542.1 hypothetical protein [Trichoplusia ni ascovirus 2c]AUS94125.1 hypothetical protein [Trichoplusia ni ascovirus 6b]